MDGRPLQPDFQKPDHFLQQIRLSFTQTSLPRDEANTVKCYGFLASRTIGCGFLSSPDLTAWKEERK